MAGVDFAVDFLVLGGGMAGMSAAASAVGNGATVLVVEKARDIGGSALLSGGGFWAPTTSAALRDANPSGDPALGRVIAEDFPSAVQWVRSLGIRIDDPLPMGHIQSFDCTGSMFDVLSYMRRCRSVVEAAGGWVLTSAAATSLLKTGDRVSGAIIREAADRPVVVGSSWTLLATGGFQNDAALRTQHVGSQAANMLVRSNPNSAGDGLRLALSVGGAHSDRMDRWYGHTVPYPLPGGLHPPDYLRFAQYYMSPRCVLLDNAGQRFVDESVGYYLNAQAVAAAPNGRALLVGDDRVRREDASGQGIGAEYIDRPLEALRAGAHVVIADTLDELASSVAPWGYQNVKPALFSFNESVCGGGDQLSPGRFRYRDGLVDAPFFGIEVQPAITFTFGGIRIDSDARVLDDHGRPVEGLLAAGADAGGMYHEAYGGGLAMSCIFGRRAARLATNGANPTTRGAM